MVVISLADRKAYRDSLRQRRKALSDREQQQHSGAVFRHFVESNALATSDCVAAYLAQDGEIDLSEVISFLWNLGKSVVVPKMSTQGMEFIELDRESTLLVNQVGIAEPVTGRSVSCDEIDVALVPLVAFSENGDRLGRGGGYYDDYFRENHSTRLIGIAHELQRVDVIESTERDRQLDAVITETGWTDFQYRAISKLDRQME